MCSENMAVVAQNIIKLSKYQSFYGKLTLVRMTVIAGFKL